MSNQEPSANGSRAKGAHRAGFAGDDAHDGREAPAAQRAPARLIPQHGCALDAEPAVAALEEDGVGGPLHAHEANGFALQIAFVVVGCHRSFIWAGREFWALKWTNQHNFVVERKFDFTDELTSESPILESRHMMENSRGQERGGR